MVDGHRDQFDRRGLRPLARLDPVDAPGARRAEPATVRPLIYQLSSDVNTCLRGALMGSAAAIDALAVSFHPRRGHIGLRRDLAKASQMLKSAYDDLQRAAAIIDQKDVRLTH